MDAEEDYLGVPTMDTAGGSKGRCFTPLPQTASSSGPMDKAGDMGDMTFCMANYVKEAMQVSWFTSDYIYIKKRCTAFCCVCGYC